MPWSRISKYLLLLVALPLQVACVPETGTTARQHVIEWPEQHLLFIADSRVGRVRSFFLGNGAPVSFAETRGVGRISVRDLQLDSQRGQLWVLGDDGVSVYDAHGLKLLRRIPLGAERVSSLRVESDCVLLLAVSGKQVGQIEHRSAFAS